MTTAPAWSSSGWPPLFCHQHQNTMCSKILSHPFSLQHPCVANSLSLTLSTPSGHLLAWFDSKANVLLPLYWEKANWGLWEVFIGFWSVVAHIRHQITSGISSAQHWFWLWLSLWTQVLHQHILPKKQSLKHQCKLQLVPCTVSSVQ